MSDSDFQKTEPEQRLPYSAGTFANHDERIRKGPEDDLPTRAAEMAGLMEAVRQAERNRIVAVVKGFRDWDRALDHTRENRYAAIRFGQLLDDLEGELHD